MSDDNPTLVSGDYVNKVYMVKNKSLVSSNNTKFILNQLSPFL